MGSTPTWSTMKHTGLWRTLLKTLVGAGWTVCFIVGQSWFRLGQEYERGQLGNAEALGLGLFPVEEAKQK